MKTTRQQRAQYRRTADLFGQNENPEGESFEYPAWVQLGAGFTGIVALLLLFL